MSRDDSNGNCSRELSEWGRNSLAWWFQLDTWKAREAICLICGIDPRKTKIEWHAATSENLDHQGTLFGPVSWNSFLYEDWHSCQTAAKQKASKDDKGMPSDEVVAVAEYISDIEFSLRTVWIRFSRAVDIETDNKAVSSPEFYLNWAKSNGIDIPWLSWAEANGLRDNSAKYDVTEKDNDRPLEKRERNTLLVIIAALCREVGIDPEDRAVAKRIAGMTEVLGCPVSYQTVLSKLKEIPEAVDRREKSN